MNNPPSIPPPHNVNDLKMLLKQYGSILSPQNRSLIQQLINELESGNIKDDRVKQVASQMQKNAVKTKSELENNNKKAAPKNGQRTQATIKGSHKKVY